MNGFGSTLMMRYKDLPPYRRSKKCKKGKLKHGKNCNECCLVSHPMGYRRCYRQCSSFGRSRKIKGLIEGKVKKGGKYVRDLTRAKFKKVGSKIRSIDKEVNTLEKGMSALMRRAERGRVGEQAIKQMNKMYSKHNRLIKQTVELEKKREQLKRVLPNYGKRSDIRIYRGNKFGVLGLKNKLKLAMQKRTIASRKIRAIIDKPMQFIAKSYKPLPRSAKENDNLKRWGEIFKRENKKVAEIKKEIQSRTKSIKRTYRGNNFSKKKTTTRRATKSRKRNIPPPLRKVPTGGKRLKYTLSLPAAARRKALTAGINSESRKRGITKEKAAIAKKGRLNVLRIYRRNSKIAECRKITMDMKWIDRTYLKSTKMRTSKIC